ncbi:uncharacterized protein N7500_003839 [Penicillium coprophilum]|uniref:uncharacterized protein n=1 Tax=Penicillium coprophilum TaxID=36646 RepID=UPI00239C65BE|nr:uncharacterized protein N7500_003839 [Penicillium coprophilum]KAJ5171056.1 hypothetical protein N7500_003839 [Penicillium coprophilum]
MHRLGGLLLRSQNIGLKALMTGSAECEEEAVRNERLVENQRLSDAMRRSWESGDFWIMYAARDNFAFDAIYWQGIDRRFFGPTAYEDDDVCDVWKERLHLLEPEEHEFMEKHEDLKLMEMEASNILAWDPDEHPLEYIRYMAKMSERSRS